VVRLPSDEPLALHEVIAGAALAQKDAIWRAKAPRQEGGRIDVFTGPM